MKSLTVVHEAALGIDPAVLKAFSAEDIAAIIASRKSAEKRSRNLGIKDLSDNEAEVFEGEDDPYADESDRGVDNDLNADEDGKFCVTCSVICV